jgi:hypothetical protein
MQGSPIPPLTPFILQPLNIKHRGHPGEEAQDIAGLHMNNARRRSNSSSHAKGAKDFKTKFETIEAEPVFEASEHGPLEEDIAPLEHQSTTSSEDSALSIAEEK